MPLRADRVNMEHALRVIALLAMAWLVAGAWQGPDLGGGEVIASDNLAADFHRWTAQPPAETLRIRLTGAPSLVERDFLRALRANGTAIIWEAGNVAPIMVDAETLEDPAGGALVRVTAPVGSLIGLHDSLGLLDSVEVGGMGVSVRLPFSTGSVIAGVGGSNAFVATPERSSPRAVVVLGMAGWETKFVIRALEERGWSVASRVALAPRLGTELGRPFPLDTARHAAVIALDSSAGAYAGAILQFVRSGGGLLLGEAASQYLPRLAPGEGGELIRPVFRRPGQPLSRQQLGFRSVTRLRDGATELESRAGRVVVAAWRVGAGRVVQSGYRESWRWRMEGGETAMADHRAWWAGLVATVAYRPPVTEPTLADPAPLASLVRELGPPAVLPSGHRSRSLWPLALAILLVSLFGEWLSRRLRGAS